MPDAYTRLILDVPEGSALVRTDELKAAWEIFTLLIHEIDENKMKPIITYLVVAKEADEMIRKFYSRPKSYRWEGKEFGSI